MSAKCAWCGRPVQGAGVTDGEGRVFCSREHAAKFEAEVADARARAEGFPSYEDMMEHYGATVVEA